MMRDSTMRKIIRKSQAKTDRDMKKKNPDYKTRAEKSRELRIITKRHEIMQLINLIQLLQSSNKLNDEISKLSSQQTSKFDMFLK